VSYFSNHFPEIVQQVHDRVAQEEGYPDPTPPPQWPADWSETDDWYFQRWSVSVDASAPPPEPEDLEPASGSWFHPDTPAA
jgi:hypothetical protein